MSIRVYELSRKQVIALIRGNANNSESKETVLIITARHTVACQLRVIYQQRKELPVPTLKYFSKGCNSRLVSYRRTYRVKWLASDKNACETVSSSQAKNIPSLEISRFKEVHAHKQCTSTTLQADSCHSKQCTGCDRPRRSRSRDWSNLPKFLSTLFRKLSPTSLSPLSFFSILPLFSTVCLSSAPGLFCFEESCATAMTLC